jgi:hypothetical protein
MGQPENDSRELRSGIVGELERAFAAALLAGDEIAAETTIREAMDARLTAAEIDEGIIERHVVALRMASNLLSGAGYWIVMLGADVPAEAQFVVGGRGLGRQLRSKGGVGICERVSEVVEAVDARVKRPELN